MTRRPPTPPPTDAERHRRALLRLRAAVRALDGAAAGLAGHPMRGIVQDLADAAREAAGRLPAYLTDAPRGG